MAWIRYIIHILIQKWLRWFLYVHKQYTYMFLWNWTSDDDTFINSTCMDSGSVFLPFFPKKKCVVYFFPTQTPPPMAQAPGTDISLMAIKSQIPVVSDLKVLQHLLPDRNFHIQRIQFFSGVWCDVVKKVARLKGTVFVFFPLGKTRNYPIRSRYFLSRKITENQIKMNQGKSILNSKINSPRKSYQPGEGSS